VNEVLLIAGMALVTLAIRYPLLALVGKISLPEPVLRALKYVPPAVLTAIIIPAMLFKGDQLDIGPGNDHLVAGLITAIVAWRSKNLLLTIVVGMITLIAWRTLISPHFQ
jgi:branched-subunit amino acid transport protein